jgi:hypothetical protein
MLRCTRKSLHTRKYLVIQSITTIQLAQMAVIMALPLADPGKSRRCRSLAQWAGCASLPETRFPRVALNKPA